MQHLLSGRWKYRAHQSARDLPGDTAANALGNGRAGFGMCGGLHVSGDACQRVEFAAEFADSHGSVSDAAWASSRHPRTVLR